MFQVLVLGANGLIRTTGGPLNDCFLKNILGISCNVFSKKSFKIYLYYFVKVCVKKFQKNVIFKVFQIHLQILLLFKNNGYKSFYTTFEGPNVNGIISYFKNL
jgi:hypothetical protein